MAKEIELWEKRQNTHTQKMVLFGTWGNWTKKTKTKKREN